MATISFAGLDKYRGQMLALTKQADAIVKMAIYDGADIVADAMRNEIVNLQEVEDFYLYEKKQVPIRGITARQKAGLLAGLGLAKMSERGGMVSTKIGMAGYNSVRTKKYPKGQPNALIARSVLRGTSYRLKDDFTGRAVRKTRAAAEKQMQKTIEQQIEKRMK